ncbi:MAG: hypothetical protein IJ958_10530 [Agathobacter sp.]|nr:hypothetical protein [Agathobacter sp.]
MNHSTSQSIIEATVSSAIKRIQNDPERSMRNMVDMGLMFCNGKFQQRFLAEAQRMLENENSSYYRIIPDLISNVDSTRITTFGINLGYHSCTKGARTIRKIEAEQGYKIPWCMALNLKNDDCFSIIEEKQAQGVYTWFINSTSDIISASDIAERFGDSAFIITCQPEDISETLLDEFGEIYNIFFAVSYSDGIEDACALLRKRKFLFSVIYEYNEGDVANILNNSLLYDFCSLHSLFSLFYANSSCSLETQKQIYEHILKTRYEQRFQTVPFDLIYDTRFIDEIISIVPKE